MKRVKTWQFATINYENYLLVKHKENGIASCHWNFCKCFGEAWKE